MRFQVVLAVIFFLSFVTNETEQSIAARNGEGEKVDWWYAIKLPVYTRTKDGDDTTTHCDCPEPKCPRDMSPPTFNETSEMDYPKGPGLCYLYADSNNPTLQYFRDLGYDCLGQGGNDPLSHTIRQIETHRNESHWAYWNDQLYQLAATGRDEKRICNAGNMKDKTRINAHSKGALCYDDTNGGFLLQGTTPNYPDPSLIPSKKGGYEFIPLSCQNNNVLYGQHYFVSSLTTSQMEKAGKELQRSRLCSANYYGESISKKFGSTLISPSFQKPTESVKKSSIYQAFANPSLKVLESSESNVPIDSNKNLSMIAKSPNSIIAPWLLVSNHLQKDISVATWLSSFGIPSLCAGDKYDETPKEFCLIDEKDGISLTKNGTINWNVENLIGAKWVIKGKLYRWNLYGGGGRGNNHGKWGISTSRNMDPDDDTVIFGDMNMEGYPCSKKCSGAQSGRGGYFLVLRNPELRRSVLRLINNVCSCSSNELFKKTEKESEYIKMRMCSRGCHTKLQRRFENGEIFPEVTSKSKSFWNQNQIKEKVCTKEKCVE